MQARLPGLVLWALLVVLISGMAYLALHACALGIPGMPPWLERCPAEARVGPTPLLDAEREGEALQRQLDALEVQIARAPACEIPPPPPPPPEPDPPAEEPSPPPPQPEPTPPPPEPDPEPIPQPAPEPEATPDPEQVGDLPADCPRRRPNEVLLALDASHSMNLDFGLDPAVEAQLEAMARVGGPPAELLLRQLMSSPATNRIDVARDALQSVVNRAPDDVVFTFVSFNQCNRPNYRGTYRSSSRPRLNQEIERVQLGDYTALADTIRALPSYVEGGDSELAPVDVVLVSDGRDSCGGDPCAAARAVAQQLPHLRINVIAFGQGLTSLQCVSSATGGQFVEARDAGSLVDQFTSAAGQDIPEHCR